MGILEDFTQRRRIKKIAQQYGGDPADYERMVSSVASSLEKLAEKLNAIGIPSTMWQNALDDIIGGSELGKIFSGGDTPALGGDMNDLRDESIWFVNKMLQQYSDQWQPDEGMPKDLFGAVMKPFYQQHLPVASEEDIQEGAYIPGVDYSMIEKLLLSWTQEADPMLTAATDQYVADVKANMERQAEGMNALMQEWRQHPRADELIKNVMYELNAAMQSEYGHNKNFMPHLRQFQAKNMIAVMTAVHSSGSLDPYNFSYRRSSLVDSLRGRWSAEYD